MCYNHVEEIELLKEQIQKLKIANKRLSDAVTKFADSTFGASVTYGFNFDYDSLSAELERSTEILLEIK